MQLNRKYLATISLTLAVRAAPGLLAADTAAADLIEHPDDHLTQPIGGAGCRIACGVVMKM